ncbi:MAG: hypothetical protein Q7I97_06200 [Thermovirgaceae bacterium]|nr:hypothetical protein [Thermovirgaceae bacterium]
MTEQRDAYVEKLKLKLDEWNTRIDQFQAKADQVKPDLKAEYQNQIQNLKAKRDKVQEKLNELSEASKGAWEDLKAGAECAWGELTEAVKLATSRYK